MAEHPRPDRPISRFPVADPAALPPDLAEAVRAAADKAGFTPNVFLAYAWRPEHFRAFFAYHDVLMKGESGLSRAERELIALAVSATNRCLYWAVAHGAALRVLSKNPYVADQVVADHGHAELSSRERAIVDFAVTVTREPAAVAEADLERLRAQGLSDADIWDAGAVAAFFNLSNRMASLADLRPNREFHGMGRPGADRPAPSPRAARPDAV